MRHWRGPHAGRRAYHHGNLKEALIEAARRFIAERGLSGFTLVDAARLVGVTPAALYRHFSGREALVAEIAFRGFHLLAERLARALKTQGTPIERFTRMGEAYLAFAEKEPGYYAAMFSTEAGSMQAEDDAPPGPWGAAQRAETAFDILAKALAEVFPDGFGTVGPRFVALEIWALSHGIATLDAARQLPRGSGVPDKHELLRAGIQALVHGAAAHH